MIKGRIGRRTKKTSKVWQTNLITKGDCAKKEIRLTKYQIFLNILCHGNSEPTTFRVHISCIIMIGLTSHFKARVIFRGDPGLQVATER